MGIAALLLALLLPVLFRARDAARKTNDLSNLRQLTYACVMYAQDYKGWLPVGQRNYNRASNSDDYTWINLTTCWQLLQQSYQAPSVSCITLQDNSPNVPTIGYGQPLTSISAPNDTALGWIYWGGRADITSGSTTIYFSPRRVGTQKTPSSQTLWTCLCYDSVGQGWMSIGPHVHAGYYAYPSGSPIDPPPDGLGVSRLDGSAAFVPWGQLQRIHEQSANDLFYDPT